MTVTQIFLTIVLIALIAYNLITVRIGQRTISATIRDLAWDWNVLPFCLGFVLSHWLFTVKYVIAGAWGYSIPVMVVITIWDIKFKQLPVYTLNPRPDYRHPIIPTCLGMILAVVVWSQS